MAWKQMVSPAFDLENFSILEHTNMFSEQLHLYMFPINEINAIELSGKIDQNASNIELVDIRTPAEVARGVLPDAKILPMHLIPLKLDYFNSEGKEFIIYCRTGSRSAQACMFLNQQGINNVVNLRGGIMSWAQQGFDIHQSPAGNIG